MAERDGFHLTEDELDSLLGGIAPQRAASHIETCLTCAGLVELDRKVVAALAVLPPTEPQAGFADRVIARVATQVAAHPPAAVLDPARAVAARRRIFAMGGLTAAGLVAAFGWASANPAAAIDLANPILAPLRSAGWFSVQSIIANATEQPWYSGLIDLLATPTSATVMVAGLAATYAAMLAGFRRVLSRPVTDADW